MNNCDIIVMGLQSWDIDIGSNCINIARQFAVNNRVLYVNRALDRLSKLKNTKDPKTARRIKSVKGQIEDLTQVEDNIWVLDPTVVLESINWMPSKLFTVFNKRNNKKLAVNIKEAAKRLGFNNPVLFVDNDFFRGQYLKGYLNPSFFIYYVRDYLLQQPYFKKHGPSCEKDIIQKADLVVSNSAYLANYARTFNKNSYDVGQGCDFTYFNPEKKYEIPADLAPIKKPVIGYVGTLVSIRLNIQLLEELAVKNKQWSFVFVGPEDEAFTRSKLHDMANVHFLGRKPETALAAYVSYFDVCINPQLVNLTTMGNYPRKIDEYLALGKPVVATYTEFMASFSQYVLLCNNLNEYENAIGAALNQYDDTPLCRERQNFALSHTWENSVKKIYHYYKALLPHGE